MKRTLFFIFNIVFLCFTSIGQTLELLELKNPQLIENGIVYLNNEISVDGHPYLIDESFQATSIFLKNNKIYKGKVNFDINIGEFVIEYSPNEIETIRVILNKSQVDSLLFNSMTFVPLMRQGSKYAELISSVNSKAFYRIHSKTIKMNNSGGASAYKYITNKPKLYLFIAGDFIQISRKKDLKGFIDETQYKEYKRYLKHKNFKSVSNSKLDYILRIFIK